MIYYQYLLFNIYTKVVLLWEISPPPTVSSTAPDLLPTALPRQHAAGRGPRALDPTALQLISPANFQVLPARIG